MKYNTVIVGGGLSGLVCGIALAKNGQRVAIVSSGQSTLHFNGGSMELLGMADGKTVDDPINAIASLPETHPYYKIGADNITALANEAQRLLADAGLKMNGSAKRNHFRISPMGVLIPAWLTLEGYATVPSRDNLPWKRVILANVEGYLDFPVDFVASGLRKEGLEVEVVDITTAELEERRHTPSEMRATQLAKLLSTRAGFEHLAAAINTATANAQADAVLMPAVLGLTDDPMTHLCELVNLPLHLVATLPPSVAGTRMQTQLRHYFQMLGGTYLLGDTVVSATIVQDKVEAVVTEKLKDLPLRADNFVLAAGSFMSKGLASNYKRVYEPIMDLDVDAYKSHTEWTQYDVMSAQPYMTYGVSTDSQFHAKKQGKPITNLYAVGAILSGHDAVKNHDGTGVSALTGLAVAHSILGK